MRNYFLAFIWTLWLGACEISCGPSSWGNDGTGWLDSCDETSDCKGALTCVCGVCTLPCDDDAICERASGDDNSSSCVGPGGFSCQDGNESAICLASCDEHWDCPGGNICENGYCGDFDDEDVSEPPIGGPADGAIVYPIDASHQDAALDAEITDAASDASDDDADVSDDDAG